MIRNRKSLIPMIVVVAVVAIALWSGNALAQQHRNPVCQAALDNPQLLAELNITQEQVAQLQEINREMRRQMAPLHSKLEVTRIDLEALLDADNPDRKAIETKVSQISDLQGQMQLIKINSQLDARQIVGKQTMDKLQQMTRGRHNRDARGNQGQQGRGGRGDRGDRSERGAKNNGR
ncbi:MAG: periplasmic heavy metal sensor [Candidatus Alcyoniella australis]|nr:periplasmic heavy metal sensor [Candidatus Alcyoniella australis]